MILERNDFKKKIKYNFDSKITRKVQNIYEKVSSDLNLYFSTKFFLALFNGVVATIIMSFFWLDFALTFWLIVFVMDFIPIVWALIALWLPFLYSLVIFDNVWTSLLMLLSMYIPQIVTWNFVEPKIMWDRLNISYIVFCFSFAFLDSVLVNNLSIFSNSDNGYNKYNFIKIWSHKIYFSFIIKRLMKIKISCLSSRDFFLFKNFFKSQRIL